jgi:hypothetical protein
MAMFAATFNPEVKAHAGDEVSPIISLPALNTLSFGTVCGAFRDGRATPMAVV